MASFEPRRHRARSGPTTTAQPSSALFTPAMISLMSTVPSPFPSHGGQLVAGPPTRTMPTQVMSSLTPT
jgi:hypothetical protein